MASVRNLWRYKKLYSFPYPIGGANVSASPQSVPVELTKYAQEDFFNRLVVRVFGNIIVAGAGAGTATGKDNPEGLLIQANLQTSPQVTGVTPINRLSARGLLYENMITRGYIIKASTVPDAAGTVAVDWHYIFNFSRARTRKRVEYNFAIQKFTSALLTLTFGGREQLFSGGTNTWDLSPLSVEIYTDSAFAVQADQIHSHELFEQNYPILSSQSDFPIDTLPSGYLYTDLLFLAEDNNVLSNAILNNIDIEGGGRVWLASGDNNAAIVQEDFTQELLETGQTTTGIYAPVSILRNGMFTQAIDSLTAPITVKLNVNGPGGGHVFNVRLVGRRMVTGAVQKAAPRPSAPAKKTA
jgi:hypothetical protein